mmetsp:Transcript_6742/g.23828  ORF Transcript_6742/g.23828 Transcript_6742/m.23828 type:complete len:309 (-) Transcript_6742:56-982(-)
MTLCWKSGRRRRTVMILSSRRICCEIKGWTRRTCESFSKMAISLLTARTSTALVHVMMHKSYSTAASSASRARYDSRPLSLSKTRPTQTRFDPNSTIFDPMADCRLFCRIEFCIASSTFFAAWTAATLAKSKPLLKSDFIPPKPLRSVSLASSSVGAAGSSRGRGGGCCGCCCCVIGASPKLPEALVGAPWSGPASRAGTAAKSFVAVAPAVAKTDDARLPKPPGDGAPNGTSEASAAARCGEPGAAGCAPTCGAQPPNPPPPPECAAAGAPLGDESSGTSANPSAKPSCSANAAGAPGAPAKNACGL